MRESDILYQNGKFWVMQDKGLYSVMVDGTTHSTSIDDRAYEHLDIAQAICDRQAKRNLTWLKIENIFFNRAKTA